MIRSAETSGAHLYAKVHYRVHKNILQDPILSQIKPYRIYLISVWKKSLLRPAPKLFDTRFPIKILHVLFMSPKKIPIAKLPPASCHFTPFGSKYSPQRPVLKYIHSVLYVLGQESKFHTHLNLQVKFCSVTTRIFSFHIKIIYFSHTYIFIHHLIPGWNP
jgi:hypothetical protein